MVVGTFPLAKLGVLFVKQISKPVANIVKERAKTHPFFKTYICLPPAYFYNWCEVKYKMWVLNLGKGSKNMPVLSETMAIELGANLLGEGIIFGLGAALLIFEYNRQQNKEIAKESTRKEEMENLTSTIRDLFFIVQTQQTQVRELQRSVGELETRAVWKPWSSSTKQDSSDEPPPSSGVITPELTEKILSFGPQPASDDSEKKPVIEKPSPELVQKDTTDENIISQSLDYIQFEVFKLKPDLTLEYSTKTEKVPSGLINDALLVLQRDLKGLLQ